METEDRFLVGVLVVGTLAVAIACAKFPQEASAGLRGTLVGAALVALAVTTFVTAWLQGPKPVAPRDLPSW